MTFGPASVEVPQAPQRHEHFGTLFASASPVSLVSDAHLPAGYPNHLLSKGIDNPQTTPENPEENAGFPKVGAPGSAVETVSGVPDPELMLVIDAWATLPAAVRASIVAMVEGEGERG